MNFQLLKPLLFAITLSIVSDQTKSTEPINRNGTRTKTGIMKAFLMQCPTKLDASYNNIQVTVQIREHSTAKTNIETFVGKLFLGDVTDLNGNYVCNLKTPSLIEVSNEEFVLMYPLKLETQIMTAEVSTVDKGFKKTTDNKKYVKATKDLNHLHTDKDAHSANNVKLLDDIYYTRLKPSDFLKRSDFMHTNPKDFRRDSICTKNFRKDNNKNNANNEYANEEFYDDKNQRENENAFSGKFRMNLNNNEIDNIKSDKKNDNENNIINDIGYFTKNLFDDKDSRKRRKNIKEHKNDFIKCVGMKIFKKIDHVLCTCARNVDEMNVDETENDEQSDCFQLINHICLWGPVYNKNINYEMKMSEDRRAVNDGGIKPTAFACCDLLPPFYLALGIKCYRGLMKDDLYNAADSKGLKVNNGKIFDELPDIIKNESDEIFDKTTSYIHSNIEKNEKNQKNNHKSEWNLPKTFEFRQINRFNNERVKIFHDVPLIDTADEIIKITNKPSKTRHFHKNEALPFDKVIYDPHLNIADKMQLINSISPKRPCERNRFNHPQSFNNRQKRNIDMSDQASLTDDELDSALENYEFEYAGGDYSGIDDLKQYSNDKNAAVNHDESLRKIQKICLQHPCAFAIPFSKDPYFRGEIKFLDNNGTNLSSKEIAGNICRDHFHEFILIPFKYANGEN